MPPKRKCTFNEDLKKKYPFLKTTISQSDVRCDVCGGTFNIGGSGNYEIGRHVDSPKNKKALTATSQTRHVTQFFPSSTDYHISACEGVWAYHVIKANHSFRSSDCSSKIIRTCFNISKFHCARTKCEAIAVNVFAPFSTDQTRTDLGNSHYVCLSVDASNHGAVKLMPVVVRFFNPTVGVKVKMLEITSEKGETSEIIENLIQTTAEAYKIKEKVVAFCGDNCPTNFGSRERGGQRNVFFSIEAMDTWFNRNLPICRSHHSQRSQMCM